jgi:hypothetical protein
LKLEGKKKDDKIQSQENEKNELNQEHLKLCMRDKQPSNTTWLQS